jgi:hypothetical protein
VSTFHESDEKRERNKEIKSDSVRKKERKKKKKEKEKKISKR